MNWFTGIIVYLLLWWVVIFCVLPFGNKPEDDERTGDNTNGITPNGNAKSAPQNPRIKQKFIITSLVAGAIWLLIYCSFAFGWFSWAELIRSYNKDLEW